MFGRKQDVEKALEPPALKPCPFCGGKAAIRQLADAGGWADGYVVGCEGCGAAGLPYRGSRVMIEYAKNCFCSTHKLLACRAWNRRRGETIDACRICGVAVPHKHISDGHRVLVVLEGRPVKTDAIDRDDEIRRLEESMGRMEEADLDEVDPEEYQRALSRLVKLRKERDGGEL